ncbi:MAG: chemotaxis protein CheW [Nitrospiraceae bacterium]|nr:chemotaxis protein CheW [Nitrospiraceae bacterium]
MEKQQEQEQESHAQATYCVFKVGEKDFLLPVELVREVVDISAVFPVPTAPDYIYGVVPVRGKVIPAVDLSKVYSTGKSKSIDMRLVIVEVELELLREVVNENIGFVSNGLPYFVTFSADIPADDVIDVKNFFRTFRIKEA